MDSRLGKRVAGVKAKHLQEKGTQSSSSGKDGGPVPTLLLISPEHRRIQMMLEDILKRSGKLMNCAGVELYRQATIRLENDLKGQVVCMILTDQVEDCFAVHSGELPLWREVVALFQQNYIESWAKEIGDEVFPPSITVITWFRRHRGKLDEDEIQKMEEEFLKAMEEQQIKHFPCITEDEVKNVVDKDMINMVLERQQQKTRMQKFTRSRNQKIAKAQKATRDARYKM